MATKLPSKLLWFVGLWIAGVLCLGVLAYVIKMVIN